ncbi:MAG: glycosyltransferase, partial [Pseudomonadota bacterium]|nr:glycosyltransferase [Pseudomonadota bacterium]
MLPLIHLYFFVSQQSLTWALVVPTYQRQNVLLRCLRLAAQQSWLAKEIIVVDASDNWTETHSKIMQGLALEYPAIDWQHVHARALSSAIQRNQGIELATADIIFLIDDDALMYPDCAETVMDIYCR